VADAVKVEHASLEPTNKKATVTVNVENVNHTFKNSDVIMIVAARIEELLEYVDKELRKIQRSRKLPGGAVLVGGTAKIPGIAGFAREKLQLPARVGMMQPLAGLVDTVDDPAFYTAAGLMLLDMLLLPEGGAEQNHSQNITNSLGGMLDTIFGFFRKG
jgi:cell division protein FtsA